MNTETQSSMEEIARRYVERGYPDHKAFVLSFSDSNDSESASMGDLRARGYLTPHGLGGGLVLTDAGLRWIIKHVGRLTDGAESLLKNIRDEYRKRGNPNHKAFTFSVPTEEEEAALNELRAWGVVERYGLGGQHRLTDNGVQWILKGVQP